MSGHAPANATDDAASAPVTPSAAAVARIPADKQAHSSPVVALLNTASGGQHGAKLSIKLLHERVHVFDLLKFVSKDEAIRKTAFARLRGFFAVHPDSRVIIGGGDGTACWALSILDRVQVCVPVCLYPLGTGNDLSRSVGWGHVYNGATYHLRKVLARLTDPERRVVNLDRWRVGYADAAAPKTAAPSGAALTFVERRPTAFTCYLSFGYDAHVAYHFQKRRTEKPELWNSPSRNKLLYAGLGLHQVVERTRPLNDDVLLVVDGVEIELPQNTRSLKLVNIGSAADGVNFWGKAPSRKGELQEWTTPTLGDGLIEVMSTTGVWSELLHRSSVGHAHRLAQGRTVQLVSKAPRALQIDGEAWIQPPGSVTVALLSKVPVVLGTKSPRSIGETNAYDPRANQVYLDALFAETSADPDADAPRVRSASIDSSQQQGGSRSASSSFATSPLPPRVQQPSQQSVSSPEWTTSAASRSMGAGSGRPAPRFSLHMRSRSVVLPWADLDSDQRIQALQDEIFELRGQNEELLLTLAKIRADYALADPKAHGDGDQQLQGPEDPDVGSRSLDGDATDSSSGASSSAATSQMT